MTLELTLKHFRKKWIQTDKPPTKEKWDICKWFNMTCLKGG